MWVFVMVVALMWKLVVMTAGVDTSDAPHLQECRDNMSDGFCSEVAWACDDPKVGATFTNKCPKTRGACGVSSCDDLCEEAADLAI